MNAFHFAGRAAAAPELTQHGDTKRARFRLIRNEYAGKDEKGERRERQVSIPFTAFGNMAESLAKNVLTGDQIIVEAAIKNNNFTDGNGVERYDYNFEVKGFEYGAPGAEKRRQLADLK